MKTTSILKFSMIAFLLVGGVSMVEGKSEKPDSISAVFMPSISHTETQLLLEDLLQDWEEDIQTIAPSYYKIYDNNGGLIWEEKVPFDQQPSSTLNRHLLTSEFLIENRNTKLYMKN